MAELDLTSLLTGAGRLVQRFGDEAYFVGLPRNPTGKVLKRELANR